MRKVLKTHFKVTIDTILFQLEDILQRVVLVCEELYVILDPPGIP